MKAELGSTSTAGHALRGGFDLVPEHVMSLSVASSAASYGKPLGYGLAGLSTLASTGADAPQRSKRRTVVELDADLDRIRASRRAGRELDGGPDAISGVGFR